MQATIDKPPGHSLAFIGGFTTEKRKAHGDGIRVYRVDLQSGLWTITDHAAGLVNPSFLVCDRGRDVLYAVHGDCEYASAFANPRVIRAALDRTHVPPETRIGHANEIAFFPPMTGG